MKTIALIGANGQLAHDILCVFDKRLFRMYPLYHRDIEIKNNESIKRCLTKLKPNIIINTAAFHLTDLCEKEAEEAFSVNALGARNLSLWCQDNNSILVQLSTDYVFGLDFNRYTPYTETDPIGPVNAYGISKAAGELFVQALVENYFIIRTSGLFGSKGSSVKGENFIETVIHKAKKGRGLKVVSDQVLCPTYTKNLAENLALLLQTNKFGLYHMVSHGQCSWYELAQFVLKCLNLNCPITPVSTKTRVGQARRPLYAALSTSKLYSLTIDRMNTWQDNVELYLKEKGYL